MLLEVVLTLERLAADLTREGDVVLVTALVDHQVVRLGEATLAVLADELALGPHLASELPPVVTLHLHNREHGAGGALSNSPHKHTLSVSKACFSLCPHSLAATLARICNTTSGT